MSNNRTKYDEEFKKRAVRMNYGSKRSVAAVAEKLGVSTSEYYKWRYDRNRRQAVDDTRRKELKL